MRIGIVGIGGVGGYIGAKFCSLVGQEPQKYDLTFIARGRHAEAVAEHGITVVEDETSYRARPSRVCSAETVEGVFDLLLVCVKSYDIPSAITALRKNIRPDTVIIPFANGVNNAEIIDAMVDAKVLNGCVYILSHIESPGVIRKAGSVFAARFGHPDYFGESLHVGYLFQDAGLRAKASEDIEVDVWKKYLFISAFATLTSYYDMSIKRVHDEHFATAQALLEEIVAVASAKGINLAEEASKALQTAATLPDEASTSMHLDFQQHRQTELENLTGYVVGEAARLGVDAPNMRRMYETLKENPYG